MYRVFYSDDCIAESELENGDPPMGCVSGLLIQSDTIQSFSELLIKLGGTESDGEYRLELNELFRVVGSSDKALHYSGGQIMAYPELDEVLIDLVGIPYPNYAKLFPDHVKAYENQFKNT